MRYLDEMTPTAIAERVRWAVNAVNVALSRMRAHAARMLSTPPGGRFVSDDRCDRVVGAWLASGDEASAAELNRMLAADASARAAYCQRMVYEAGIRGALKDEATEARPWSAAGRSEGPRW